MKNKLFILVGFLTCNTLIFGQEIPFSCGHTHRTQQLWEKDPQLKTDYEQLIANAKQVQLVDGIMKTTYVVPVVFHILHEYGTENISDAQIYDQMEILNRDFRKANADTATVIPEFKQLIADCNIEFRLATRDPLGNCTNGIDRIFTHETTVGDDFSKLNQWRRSQYLNIWVCKSMRDGVAGYAYYPTDIAAVGFFADGIIILNQYIGSIGTGNPNLSRALSHEIGHYLGLAHPWGSTNQPGVACGDDGVSDTPLTEGFNFCPTSNAQATVCTPGVVENYQNFMDYSYCSKMFTIEQGNMMRNVLEFPQRRDLWTDSNLELTGALINPPPLCKPIADFNTRIQMICEGTAVSFRDASWNGVVTSRQWIFEDGTPATSTAANQNVTFAGFGPKRVTLIVSNDAGSDTLTETISVFNSQGWAEITGPFSEDFNENANWYSNWLIDDFHGYGSAFELQNDAGRNQTKGFVLRNFRPVQPSTALTNGSIFQDRLGGAKDAIISPSINLSSTSGAELVFDYAYATNATTLANITEDIKVYLSKDCGRTWMLRRTIDKQELLTAGNGGYLNFVPKNTEWKTASIPLNLNSTDTRNRYKIEFTASDFSNNLYIDNIRITGVLGVDENPFFQDELVIFPNPLGSNEALKIRFQGSGNIISAIVTDIQGKTIIQETFPTNASETNQIEINSTAKLLPGMYLLTLKDGEYQITKTFIQR